MQKITKLDHNLPRNHKEVDQKTGIKQIIALYGPAGIGKTTVAEKLCRELSGKTARISVDKIREMTYCFKEGSWKESDEYITSGKKVVLPLTKEYINQGYNVVIEVAPPTTYDNDNGKTDKWLALSLKKIGALVFLLDAPLAIILERNEKREQKPEHHLNAKLIEKLYNYCQNYLDIEDYIVINTEKINADKTKAFILKKMKRKR
jgi:tRNA uridine 5-carbamoylmethylation protein Kti12